MSMRSKRGAFAICSWVDGAFHNREEIETLRAALMAIEWPDDHLSVFATLRGSLFAIGDEELLEYHQACRRFHPFRVPDTLPVHLHPVRDALMLLAALHRDPEPPAGCRHDLDAAGAHAGARGVRAPPRR